MKTRRHIERLKGNWLANPLWPLEDTEGFDAHHNELRQFRIATEARWKAAEQEQEAALDAKAEQLGVHGLLRLVRRLEALQRRHANAICLLTEGRTQDAWAALTEPPGP